MGLLTDPSAGQGKLTKFLLNYYSKICFLMYVAGVVWFCLLSYTPMNNGTYFSENALLPGLVKSEFMGDSNARLYNDELADEMKKYENSIPYSWLLAKFRQIGLDTYTHNFTLNYPLGKPQVFTGKNVYAILRAPRASSTEALVLSVPYRPPLSVHETTAPSIAIMLAFAKYASRENYWSKDIIFLITEHEQLGVQAWLNAYHGVQTGEEGVLNYGDLRGRGGAIQAAINLELHDAIIGQIDVKIEGLNGQLPNLDLFNLATKMCVKESVHHTFKNRPSKSFRDPVKQWLYSFKTLMAMVSTQATGIPNGNHGLFHRFGIEALTMEGHSKLTNKGYSKASFMVMGRILEGIFRSLNNLLERFHQSYFFYLLPSSERFISIGLYMPVIVLIAGTLFIKACAKWCKLQEHPLCSNQSPNDESADESEEEPESSDDGNKFVAPETQEKKKEFYEEMRTRFEKELNDALKDITNSKHDSIDIIQVLSFFILAHFIGVLLIYSPPYFTKLGSYYGYKNEVATYTALAGVSVLLLFSPLVIGFKNSEKSMVVLNIFAHLELGTVVVVIAMNNFSLGLCCAVLHVPFALLITPTRNRFFKWLQRTLWLIAHPLLVVTIIVVIYTQLVFPEKPFLDNFYRGIGVTHQAILYSIVDSMIYSNWLFNAVCGILLPNWICLWWITFTNLPPKVNVTKEKKTN